ncbi:hypothetical protein [Aquimarina sp. LLG6339-5]|uniref:hypothetical protein n=1 Tax=Aquimarina sp. LLG6339-5 TaxID=3160830 RepID=UPI00386D73D2
MKNQILNIGKPLNKTEQKKVFGGKFGGECKSARECWMATGQTGSATDYLCIDGHCAFNPF